MKTVSVVIVLYNEFDLVQKCIASVYTDNIPNMEIILVDNSTDKNGYKKVLKKFPKIIYVQNEKNIGFAPAVNIGCKVAKGKFILILTPDTTVLPGTIKQTLSYIQKHPKVGLVGCKVLSASNKLQLSSFKKFPDIITHLYEYNVLFYKMYLKLNHNSHPSSYSDKEHTEVLFPKHIIGAYLLLRKNAGEEVGYFDKIFTLYREETDLCKKLGDKGWLIAYLPVGGLVHIGGASWKKTTITQALPPYMKSVYLFFYKHYGKPYAIFAWFIGLSSSLMSIPYLFVVSNTKKTLGKKSQSTMLLPCWIDILKWHVTKGITTVFLASG